jgi:hypothetical protein
LTDASSPTDGPTVQPFAIGTSAEGWIADAFRFWTKHIDRPAQFEGTRTSDFPLDD